MSEQNNSTNNKNLQDKLKNIKPAPKKPFYCAVKRCFDVFCSALAIILLCWLYAIIAVVIKVSDGGPVFYISERVGKNGKIFKFYKFRSMCVNADEILENLAEKNEAGEVIFKMEDDPRITKVGRFLRKTSLDELPQLFNILKGDMSLVGPRPPLPKEVEQYDETAMQRLSVIGGLTCYWQIMGRSKIPFDGMVKLDMQYIGERSFRTDLKILFKTIPSVLKGDGAY